MPFQPGVYDVFAYQFSDWSLNVGWRINEFPVDPGSYTASMTVKTDASTRTVLVSLTTENGRIDTLSLPGWLVLRLDAATTGGLPSGKFAYDLIVNDGQSTWPVMRGRFVVRGSITGGEMPALIGIGVDHG